MNAWHYRKAAKPLFAVAMIMIMLVMAFVPNMYAFGAADDNIKAFGYSINKSYVGKWSTGNLGSTYEEGEWAAFQTIVTNVDWLNLDNLGVRYDFYDAGKNSRFYDLVRNVSIGNGDNAVLFPTGQLPDDYGFPQYDGTPFPLGTESNTNAAQRDPNILGEHYFDIMDPIIFSMAEYETQVNRPSYDDPLNPDGLDTDPSRVFYITRDQMEDTIIAANLADPGRYPGFVLGDYGTYPNKIVLYFQLHLSRTWIWNNRGDFDHNGVLDEILAYSYSLPGIPTVPWGGYVYTPDFLTKTMYGAAGFPGSSGHSYVFINNGASGEKTLPIPNVEETAGMISGIKFEDVNANGVYDEGLDMPLPNWKIYLRTDLYAIPDLEFPTTTDENGYYEFVNIPYNLTWELTEQLEPDYMQTYPFMYERLEGVETGDPETDWYKDTKSASVMGGYSNRAEWGWEVKLSPDHLMQTDINFGNTFADPRIEIVKTGDALSKIGDEVTYTFEVTNIGNVDLTLVNIDDDRMGILDAYGIAGGVEDVLPVGEMQSFSMPWIIPGDAEDPYTNIVTANYEYFGIPALDAADLIPIDDHTIELFQPSIEITKTADGISKVGDPIDYTIVVSNTSSPDSPNLIGSVDDPLIGFSAPVNLAPGASETFTPSYEVQPGDPDPFVNTVTVTTSPEGFPNVIEASATETTELFQPGVTIEKTGPELSKVGDDVTYVITVTNAGSADSPAISGDVSDPMLDGWIEAPYSWHFDNLAVGDSHEIQVTYTVQPGDADPLMNTASVLAMPDGFPNELTAEDSHEINLFQPSIEITKTADGLSKVGDPIEYTIVVTNTSSPDSPNLVGTVDDPLIGFSAPVNLAPGASETFTPSYEVQPGDPDPFVNTVTVTTSPEGFPNVIEASATETTELFQPGVTIEKTGPELSKVGDDVTYVITVTNAGSADSPAISGDVSDPMLDGWIEAPYSWHFDNLPVGDSHEIQVTYTVQPGDADPLMNTASVLAMPDGFPNELIAEDSHEINLFQPSIEITKTADGISKVGDPIQYTIVVTNTSSPDSPNLIGTVDDPLIGFSAPVNLAPGASETFTPSYEVQPGDPDPFVNTVTVTTSPEGFPNVIEASATETTELFQPGVTIEKTGPELSKVGDDVTYVITVTNAGSADSPAISGDVSDPMLDGWIEAPYSWHFDNLPVGDSHEIQVTYTVQPGDADPLMNTASVLAMPDGFPNELTAEDSHEINLFQPSIEITKTADGLSKVGDPIEYTIVVTNTSSPDSPNLVGTVDDPLIGFSAPVNLAPGASETFTPSYEVQPGDPDPFVNTVTVTTSPEGFPNVIEASATETTELFQPGVTIEKTGPELSKVGDDVTYVITVTNAGSADSPAISGDVSDPMLDGWIEAPYSWHFDNLPVGDSHEIQVTYTVQPGDADPLMNTASVLAMPDGFPNELTAEDSHEINLFQPSIEIAKTGDELSKVGDEVQYTIVVSNTSSPDSPNLMGTVEDSLLGELEGNLNLAPGESVTYQRGRVVLDSDPNPIINTATVIVSPDGFPNVLEASDSHETDLFEPSLWITKTGDELSKVGDEVTYTITVGNASTGNSPNLIGQVVDGLIGLDESFNLAPGEEMVFTVPFTIPSDASDPFVNTATATASPEGFPNVLEVSDSHEINLFQPGIEVYKTADEISKAGDTVQYMILVRNTSSSDTPALEIELSDPMLDPWLTPSDKSFMLDPGQEWQLDLPYIVQPDDPDPLVNEVTITASPFGFPNEYTETTTATTDLVHPSIEIVKTVSPEMVQVGDWVTYEITITNTGDWPLENVVVSDDLHQGLLDALAVPFSTILGVGDSETRTFEYQTQATDPVAPEPLVDVADVYANPEGLPNDITDVDDAELLIVHYTDETAWGRYEYDYPASPGAIDFEDLDLDQWGWTNGPFNLPFDGPLVLELYADQDVYVGTVTFEQYDTDMMRATYELEPGVILEDVHLYMGETMLPMRGSKYRASPGQFPYTSDTNVIEFSIADMPEQVYIAAHAVVLMPASLTP